MSDVATSSIRAFDWFVLAYFLALSTSYLYLIMAGGAAAFRSLSRPHEPGQDDMFASPMTPSISVILPAYNEEAGILQATHAALNLRYPNFEVVVVDDGSKDATFEVLRSAFDLVEIDSQVEADVRNIGDVLSLHVPTSGEPLVVVRKVNAGRRSDALNVGINAARSELVCCVDGDSLLEPDALLRVAKPFVDDPARVKASGGAIRIANGAKVHRGRVVDVRQPSSWLARIQVLEYLRSFLLGRTGWARFEALVLISGAFGLYRREDLVAIGGFNLESLAEDLDCLLSIHRLHRDAGNDYRVAFVPEPVCWTEVPESRATLSRQRQRWSSGLAETLWGKRRMILNPRYGRVGMVALPYYVLFELIAPVVEIVGLVAVVGGVAAGIVSVQFALLFGLVALLYGVLVSVAALMVEEAAFARYPRWHDLWVAMAAAVIENFGFRQMHAWWRLKGLADAVRRKDRGWGEMPRLGFATES